MSKNEQLLPLQQYEAAKRIATTLHELYPTYDEPNTVPGQLKIDAASEVRRHAQLHRDSGGHNDELRTVSHKVKEEISGVFVGIRPSYSGR